MSTDDAADFGESVTDTADIDWGALWREYDFDTPDADDSVIISGTQLEAAVEVSEQNIAGTPREHIADAVDADDLVVKTTAAGTKMGYLWEGML